jgi:hypothetical protein
MTHNIQPSDLKEILAALREGGNRRRVWIATQLESADLSEKLKTYDPPDEFRHHIRLLCAYLQANFRLDDWKASILFVTEPTIEGEARSSDIVKATISVDEVYLHYVIEISAATLEQWRKNDFAGIGYDLCHEFCHILMQPVARLAMLDAGNSQKWLFTEIIERQVQRFSVVIGNSLPDDWFTPDALQRWALRHPSYAESAESAKS